MSKDTNIGYWERVLKAPTPAYQKLFDVEHEYLVKEIPKDSRVLDVGCGEGRNMKSIFEVTPNVCGVDNDINAINDAKKNFIESSTVEIVQAEASKLPFADKTFDVVTFLMILPNLDKDREKAIKEVARVLKDRGFVILSTFSETAFEERMRIYKKVGIPIEKTEGTKLVFNNGVISEQFSLEDVEELASSAGMKVIKSERIGSLAYICELKK